MTASERREEIMRILAARRKETVPRLAAHFSVSKATIYSDITVLTAKYPIDAIPGNKGGVRLADWYHPNSDILSAEQQEVLLSVSSVIGEYESKILREILREYGSPEYIKRLADR